LVFVKISLACFFGREILWSIHVDDASNLEPQAPGRGQGRVDARGSQSARFVVTSLRRDECNAKHLYEKVYAPAQKPSKSRITRCTIHQ
jgi:hypothetical protein